MKINTLDIDFKFQNIFFYHICCHKLSNGVSTVFHGSLSGEILNIMRGIMPHMIWSFLP